MTDMNGFNPDKKLGAHFKPNNQAKKQANAPADKSEATVANDPYADLKMDPSRMLDLLAAQGKSNQVHANVTGSANAIEKSIDAFTEAISPERHSLITRMLEQTFQNEFGKKPAPGVLQDIIDDYLIGQPVIQTS